MKLLLIFISIGVLAGCVKTVDLQEYNDEQLRLERNHG